MKKKKEVFEIIGEVRSSSHKINVILILALAVIVLVVMGNKTYSAFYSEYDFQIFVIGTFLIGLFTIILRKNEKRLLKLLNKNRNVVDYGICRIRIDDNGIEIIGRESIQWEDVITVREVRNPGVVNMRIITITYEVRRDVRNIYIQNTRDATQLEINLARGRHKGKLWRKYDAPKEIDEETYERVKKYLNQRYDFAKVE